MFYNSPETKDLADFINTKVSYAEQHKTTELETLYELIDVIADLMDNEQDREDWYHLVNTISPENVDENAIS